MNQSRVVLVALVGLLVVATATHILAEDELQYQDKPAAADGAEQSDNGLNPLDNTINDKRNENGFGQDFEQRQQQPSQWSPLRPIPGLRPRPIPSPPSFSNFGEGFGDPFGLFMPNQQSSPGRSFLGRLFPPIDSIFDNMHRRMSSEFNNLQSMAGAGEEVTEFMLNNQAFRKTCKVERIDPSELNQQSVPNEQNQQSVPDNKQIDQQLQPQLEQPQQSQQQQERRPTTPKPL